MTVERARVRDSQGWRPRPTLTGADYTSEPVYEEERERLFFDGWVCIGRADEVPGPGDYLVRDVVGESVFVVRNRDGELRAFYNVCAHRGTQLLDDEPACGHLGKALKCPVPRWSYDLDGRLLATPNVHEDEQFDVRTTRSTRSRSASTAASCSSAWPRSRAPLLDSLRDSNETIIDFERYRMDELRLGARLAYEVAANWKTVVENYNECLHCPTIHPELVAVVPLYPVGRGLGRRDARRRQPRCSTARPLQRRPARPTCRASRTCSTTTTACTTASSSSRT